MSLVATHPSELAFVAREVLRYPGLETGGELLGSYSRGGTPVVQLATGAGPCAARTFASFRPDESYLSELVTELSARYFLQDLGGWHSHHGLGLEGPSHGDEETVWRAMERCGLASYLLVIASCRPEHLRPGLRAFHFEAGASAPTECELVLLEAKSPVRAALEAEPPEADRCFEGGYTLSPEAMSVDALRKRLVREASRGLRTSFRHDPDTDDREESQHAG